MHFLILCSLLKNGIITLIFSKIFPSFLTFDKVYEITIPTLIQVIELNALQSTMIQRFLLVLFFIIKFLSMCKRFETRKYQHPLQFSLSLFNLIRKPFIILIKY